MTAISCALRFASSKRLRFLHVGRRHRASAAAELHKIAKKYLDLKRLRPYAEKATKANLLRDARLFEKASLADGYYESFDVNAKNCTQQSTGTSAWMAGCLGLLDRCVADVKVGSPTEVSARQRITFTLI